MERNLKKIDIEKRVTKLPKKIKKKRL